MADPHQIRDLAGDPAHGDVLERMRSELDRWLEASGDLGVRLTEREMVEGMWPDGLQPVTARPRTCVRPERDGRRRVELETVTSGASQGYRTRSGEGPFTRWLLYTGPFLLDEGTELETKAVRYGYRESPAVRLPAGQVRGCVGPG